MRDETKLTLPLERHREGPYILAGLLQRNVGETERLASIVAGVALVGCGLAVPRAQRLATLTGIALIGRGLVGWCPFSALAGRDTRHGDTRRELGGPRGIVVAYATTVNRPVADVYRFWRGFENLPRAMRHLESVTLLDDTRSHWVARGPAGTRVEWDATIVNEVENKVIGWRSLEHADVSSAGSVNVRQAPGGRGTELRVRLQYAPPAGRAGAWIGWLAGEEPSLQIREDLRRVKQLLEAGEIATTEGQPAGRGTSARTP
ncbi:MAG: SRPBCC family protein [Vicinamibacteraceae bacterium]